MADFPLSSAAVITPRRSAKGSPRILDFQESTAASTRLVKYGQVVSMDLTASATHRIVHCSTVVGALAIKSTSIIGVAAAGSTSDGSTTGLSNYLNRRIPVYLADPDTEFRFPTKLLIGSSLVGRSLNLLYDSTLGIHHAGDASTTTDGARIWGTAIEEDTLGDTGGFVYGRFWSSVVHPIANAAK